jgi:hypothetical protein
VSVGHVARLIEMAGIPTVAVFVRAFRHIAVEMGLPRVVVTQNPMGRPLGPPGDADRQQAVVDTALGLLEAATAGGTIVDLAARYRPGSD